MAFKTLSPLEQAKQKQPGNPPPLHNGDRLSRTEFEFRYHSHPEIKKAELIEGVVYMASPVRYEQHSKPHAHIIGWLAAYTAATPKIDLADNATLVLDNNNEPQPDALLRIEADFGGKSKATKNGYLEGAPELIIEVTVGATSYDMHEKKDVYARNGVQEYLVILTYEKKLK